MTPRERLRATFAHKEPDRIPVDFGGSSVSGIHVSCVAALRDYYGLEKRPVKVHEPYQMLGLVEDDLQEAMGLDVVGVFRRSTLFGFPNENWKPWRMYDGLEVLVSEHFQTTVDENGDTLIYPGGDTSVPASGRMPKGGYFFDTIVRQEPLDEDNLDPEDNMEEFKLLDDKTLEDIKDDVAEANRNGRAILASFGGTALGDIAVVPGPFMKRPKGIRDITEWYMSIAMRPDYIKKIFERQVEIALQNLARIYEKVGDTVDAVFLCGTDFGTQKGTFCSVNTFQDLWFPYYKQINDWVHANTGWKCFKHSCGSVERFIPQFIDSGFDILNPVQCSAANMAPEHLKSTYGDRIVFWGGGVDTQKTLPFGTPEEVRREVLSRCEIFGKGGGFVFNTIHNIQAQTPVKNIVAMLDAVKEFNGQK